MRPLLILLALTAMSSGCSKKTDKAGKLVEIYLLENAQMISGKCQVNPVSAVLQDVPVISNEDIVEYSQLSHAFLLTDAGFKKAKELSDWTAFAVTVDKQVIYYGFFKPAISSSTCFHSITMDVSLSQDNRILFRLGYPGTSTEVQDLRSDKKLMTALSSQGKLKL